MATIQDRNSIQHSTGKERGDLRRRRAITVAAALATATAVGLSLGAAHGENDKHNANMSSEAMASVSHVLNGTATLTEGANVRTSPITNNDPDMSNLAFQLDGKRLIVTNPVEHADPDTNDVWIGFTDPTAESEGASTVWANLTQLERQGFATAQRDATNPEITVQNIDGQLHNMEVPNHPVLAGVGTANFVE